MVLLLPAAGWSQPAATSLTEPPIPLLSKQLPGLERVGDGVVSSDPAQADAANAAMLKEDGLERYASAEYTRTAGGGKIAATAMQFVDATAAFSAYTFYRMELPRAKTMTGAAKLGKESVENGDTTLVWAGTSVLRVTGTASGKELLTLTSALPKVSGRKGLAPLLPTLLPAEGLEGATTRYAVGPVGYKALGGELPGDVVGFDKNAEVITAKYGGKVGRGELMLLLYPTPQIAGEKGRAIEKALNEDRGLHDRLGMVKMRRLGPLLEITGGGFSAPQAEAMLGAVHLNEQVAFDQKKPLEFQSEVKKTASLLQNILFFCVVVGGGAILLGLFLGGGRAGIRVLQGKPAHVEPEFLTINLRGGPASGPEGGRGV